MRLNASNGNPKQVGVRGDPAALHLGARGRHRGPPRVLDRSGHFNANHILANMAHIRQPRPDFALGFDVTVLLSCALFDRKRLVFGVILVLFILVHVIGIDDHLACSTGPISGGGNPKNVSVNKVWSTICSY